VLAIGYSPETDIPESTPNLKTTKWGSVIVETEETGVTSREDLYAAGDNVRGADLVVTAVAAARKAALAMHNKLLAIRERRCRRTSGEIVPATGEDPSPVAR
jgi:glutamate synthase (NADPH/NADH) small chain